MNKKYTIIIKETAQKQIKRLPAIYLEKVKETIFSLADNPALMGLLN